MNDNMNNNMNDNLMKDVYMSVYAFIRQIENQCNIAVPMDIKILCFLHSKELLFVAFKLAQLQQEIEIEEHAINERVEMVEAELQEAKPAVVAAQKAVANINRQQIHEIRSWQRPSRPVEMTLNAVALLRNKKIRNWSGMQRFMAARDFIPSILKFDTNLIRARQRAKVQNQYLSNEDFTFERVNKASKCAGLLVLWVQAQVNFSRLLDSVEPMTKEINVLKAILEAKKHEADVLNKKLNEFQTPQSTV